jgi:Flp pilus assembly pilin Flp
MTQRWGISLSKFRSDSKGQDMIEYALMLGFLAVAAGTILPSAASSIGALFSQIGSVVKTADSSSGDPARHRGGCRWGVVSDAPTVASDFHGKFSTTVC